MAVFWLVHGMRAFNQIVLWSAHALCCWYVDSVARTSRLLCVRKKFTNKTVWFSCEHLRFIVPRLVVHYFSLYVNLCLERFQSSVVKLKVTPSLWLIAEDIDNPLNQSKLKHKIRCSWREAHKNMRDWVTVFFRAFFKPVVYRLVFIGNKQKPTYSDSVRCWWLAPFVINFPAIGVDYQHLS